MAKIVLYACVLWMLLALSGADTIAAAERGKPLEARGGTVVKSLTAPTIDPLPTTTSSNPLPITGTAAANAQVRIFVNGELLELTTADSNGAFAAKAPLYDGNNDLHAVAASGQDESPASSTASTTYTNALPRSQSGSITSDTVWTPAGGAYVLNGDLTIASGVELRLMPGVEVRSAALYEILVEGALVAYGTASSGIAFRSGLASPNWGSWTGITVNGAGFVDFDYVTVEHGANALKFTGGEGQLAHTTLRNSTVGAKVEANSSPVCAIGCVVTGNNYGVWIAGNGVTANNPLPSFRNGTISGNVNYNVLTQNFGNGGSVVLDFTGNWWGTTDVASIAYSIYDHNYSTTLPMVNFGSYLGAQGGTPVHTGGFLFGSVTTNRTLNADTYHILGNLRIAAGATLTVPPGATLRAPIGNAFVLEVNGTLYAHGTSSLPIVFQGSNTTPGRSDWGGIRISDSGFVDLEHVVVEHAQNALHFVGGEGELAHTTLRTSNVGAQVEANSSPECSAGCVVTANNYGLQVKGNNVAASDPRPSFRNGAITANQSYNVWTWNFGDGANTALDFTGNWWGTVDPVYIRGTFFDRQYSGALPHVNYLDFAAAAGGAPYLFAFDFVFPGRTVDVLAGGSSQLGFTLNTASTVVVDVVREDSGQVVRSASLGSLPPGPVAFSWDGKDDNNAYVAGGLYRFVPRLSKSGNQWTQDPPSPGWEGEGYGDIPVRFHPYRNEFFKMAFQNSSGQPNTIEMQVTPLNGTTFKPFSKQYWAGSGTDWIYWDGRDPQGNILTGEVAIYFPTPKALRPWHVRVLENSPQITGTQAAPAIEVKSDPYLITHSYEHLSRIAFRLSLDSTVSVKLLPPGIVDPSSSQAITLMAPQLLQAKNGSGVPIDHVVEWRGHEVSDPNRMRTADEGAFTFAIQAQSTLTGRTTLYRGVLQIQR